MLLKPTWGLCLRRLVGPTRGEPRFHPGWNSCWNDSRSTFFFSFYVFWGGGLWWGTSSCVYIRLVYGSIFFMSLSFVSWVGVLVDGMMPSLCQWVNESCGGYICVNCWFEQASIPLWNSKWGGWIQGIGQWTGRKCLLIIQLWDVISSQSRTWSRF